MIECTDKKLGDKLNAYELGMLSGEEREEFEMHLMECEACMEKAREFKKAADLLRLSDDLKTFVHDLAEKERTDEKSETAYQAKRKRKLWPRFASLIGVSLIVTLLLILQPWHIEIQPTKEAVAFENMLAIMYFGNLVDEEDANRMAEITSDLLITDLSESDYMSVVSGQRLYDLLRQLGYEDQRSINRDIATQVAEQAHAKWILVGNLLQMEPEIVLTSQLTDVKTGKVIASQKVAGSPGEDIFAVVDKLSAEVKSDLSLPEKALEEPDIPVIDLTTNSLDAYKHYLEGRRLFYKGLKPESMLAFRKAIALDSTFAMAYLPLAVMLAAGNDPEAMLLISYAHNYVDKTTTRERLFIQALYSFLHKNYQESYEYLTELTQKYPDDKHAIYWLGWQTLHTRNQPEKAIEYFSRVLELDSMFMNAYDQTAKAYFDLNDYEKSIWYLDKYIDMNPNDIFPYYTRGRIYYWNHDYEKAIKDLEKSIQLKSDFYQSHEYLARIYLRKSDFDKARTSYQILASDHENKGKRSDARTGLALVSMFQGKLDEALNILGEGIRQDSLEDTFHGDEGDMAHKYFFKAKIYLEKENSDSALYFAEQCMNSCYKVKDENELCFAQYYVEFLARAGKYSLAEQQADDIKRKLTDAGEPLAWYWFAMACIEQSRINLQEAEKYINKALESGNLFDFEYKQAEIYLTSNQADKAIKAFSKIKSNNFVDYRPLLMSKLDYYLGLAYELDGQNSKAIEHYNSFLNKWKDADNWIKEINDTRERLSRLTEE